jgi:hypothetical protein
MVADRQPTVAGSEGEPMKALAVMVVAVCLAACGANPVDDPGTGPGVVVDLSSHEQVIRDWVIEGRDPAPDVNPGDPDGAGTPSTDCVAVQCRDALGPDGTRCVWIGCSLVDALSACAREAPRVCARIVCPFVFVGRGTTRFENGACR